LFGSKFSITNDDSDEFLNYACANRDQWEKEGEDVVKHLVQSVENDVEIQRIGQKYQKDGDQKDEDQDAKETDVAVPKEDELNASTKDSNSAGTYKKEHKECAATAIE